MNCNKIYLNTITSIIYDYDNNDNNVDNDNENDDDDDDDVVCTTNRHLD